MELFHHVGVPQCGNQLFPGRFAALTLVKHRHAATLFVTQSVHQPNMCLRPSKPTSKFLTSILFCAILTGSGSRVNAEFQILNPPDMRRLALLNNPLHSATLLSHSMGSLLATNGDFELTTSATLWCGCFESHRYLRLQLLRSCLMRPVAYPTI